MTTKLLLGHVLDRLAMLPDESVHMGWTSPPYWGLRSYKTAPQIWGALGCEHVWGAESYPDKRGIQLGKAVSSDARQCSRGDTCIECGAWRGEHGLEPTFDLWLEHEVAIFREFRRVLRDDGTLWVNIGDAYAGSVNGRSADDTKEAGDDDRTFRDKPVDTAGGVFKLKDRLLMPARLAIALQADGWYLRDEIVLHKLNPMPSSVKDRTCPAHEMLYLFSKCPRYFYDWTAIVEPFSDEREGRDYANSFARPAKAGKEDAGQKLQHRVDREPIAYGRPASERNRGGRTDGFTKPNDVDPSANGGRIKRSVWTQALEPFPEAHFATAPTGWVRPCILAGTSSRGVCPDCGAQWQRITRKIAVPGKTQKMADGWDTGDGAHGSVHREGRETGVPVTTERTIGWYPPCACDGLPDLAEYPKRPKGDDKPAMAKWRVACAKVDDVREAQCVRSAQYRAVPATVLDPFFGAGTTGLVAGELGRDCIGIELNPDYAKMARKRLRISLGRVKSDLPEERPTDLPLFAEAL